MANDTPDPYGDDPTTTLSSDTRWTYIASVLSAIVITSLPVVIVGTGLGLMTVAGISQGWLILYSTVVLMAATWVFGEETLNAVRRARENNKE